MFTHRGYASGSWVHVESGCHISHVVTESDVEFEFSSSLGSLTLTVSGDALDRLAEHVGQAQTARDARPQ